MFWWRHKEDLSWYAWSEQHFYSGTGVVVSNAFVVVSLLIATAIIRFSVAAMIRWRPVVSAEGLGHC